MANKLAELKSAGFDDTEISQWAESKKSELFSAGFSPSEVDGYLGVQFDKEPVKEEIGAIISQGQEPSLFDRFVRSFQPDWETRVAKSQIATNISEEKNVRPSIIEQTNTEAIPKAIKQGVQQSVAGLSYRGKLPDGMTQEEADNMPNIARLISQSTTMAMDLPYMVVGSILGASGGPVGSVGGAFALPAGLRKVYIDKITKGEVTSFKDFFERLTGAVYETLKGEATGIATGSAGIKFAGSTLKYPAEIVAMVSVGDALEGKVPEPKEFADAALLIGGLHIATKISGKLQDIYTKKGVTPAQVLEDVRNDENIRREILRDDIEIPRKYEEATAPTNEKIAQKGQSAGELTEDTRINGVTFRQLEDIIINDKPGIKNELEAIKTEHGRQGMQDLVNPGKLYARLRQRLEVEEGLPKDQVKTILQEPFKRYEQRFKEVEGIESDGNISKGTTISSEEGSISIGKPKGTSSKFTFDDPAIEVAHQYSMGVQKDPIRQRIFESLKLIGSKIKESYDTLPNVAKFAEAHFSLKKLEKQKQVASYYSIKDIEHITKDLSAEDYNLFSRKVILDDLAQTASENLDLPDLWTPDSVAKELKRVNDAIKDNSKIKESLKRRREVFDRVKKDLMDARKDIGMSNEMFTRENYFRHQVLDFVNSKGLMGTGKKLKSPAKSGYLRKRKGSTLSINTDYIQSEYEVLAQMMYDTEVARTIKNIDSNYNIAKQLKKEAKKAGREEIEIPDGFTEWQPQEGNVFYMADTIPAQLAEKLTSGILEEVGLTVDDVGKVMAIGKRRKKFIIPNEVAETLNNLTKTKPDSLFVKMDSAVLNAWKQWQLISPRRIAKYNIRNLTGDADVMFAGNPASFKKVPEAIKDLWDVYYRNKSMSKNLKDWHDRGGMGSNIQVQEMGELNDLRIFMALKHPNKKFTEIPNMAWQAYWKNARLATDFRESILRYASYLHYVKEMKASPDGLPKNYAASNPEMIKGLSSIEDRAYAMSNDLLGAYDKISSIGQSMRQHVYPFWSFKEVNFRRYARMINNASNNPAVASMIGRKMLGSGVKTSLFTAMSVGKWALRATAFMTMVNVWNNLMFPQEEEELTSEQKSLPHIILGRDENGEIITFTRLGAVSDFLNVFGLDSAPEYVNKYLKGRMTIKEISTDIAKQPFNTLINGSFPFVKLGAELITRQSLFPDISRPGTIRDRGLHLARSLGLENEYLALSDTPSLPYASSLPKLFIYRTDPYQAAYSTIMDTKNRFLENKGKYGSGFWITPKGNALYNSRLALRYGDVEQSKKYLLKYLEMGGDVKAWSQSFESMNPLSGLSNEDKTEFLSRIATIGYTNKLVKAFKYWEELRTGLDISKQDQEKEFGQ